MLLSVVLTVVAIALALVGAALVLAAGKVSRAPYQSLTPGELPGLMKDRWKL